MVLTRTRSRGIGNGEGSKPAAEMAALQGSEGVVGEVVEGTVNRAEEAARTGVEAYVETIHGSASRGAQTASSTPRKAGLVGDGAGQAIRSPLLSSQRPDFRTMSMDSQQFLQHALSVDGEALQQYLENETGAHFTRLSVSPTKQGALGMRGMNDIRIEGNIGGVPLGEEQQHNSAKAGRESNETQLADMMHSLVDDPHFDVGMLQAANLQPLGGELLSADTLDRVLGGEMRQIAAEVRVKEEDGLASRVMEGIQANVADASMGNLAQDYRAMPPPVPQEPRIVQGGHQPVAHPKNQYVTFMDGDVLQRDDGTPAIVTFPENSMAASVQVPIPGSDRHLQFVPLLNSAVGAMGAVQVGGSAADAGILSPSQTERMVADAAKQHAELVIGVETHRKSAELEVSYGKERKPQLRLVDSGEFEGGSLRGSHDGGSGQLSLDAIERKVSHKRERSVTLRELPNLELDKLPSAKLVGAGGNIVGNGTQYQNYPQHLNANCSVAQVSEFFAATDVRDAREQSTPPTPSTEIGDASEDARKQLTAYVKPLKLFCNGLDDLIDDEIRSVISNTLETPPGTKRRGRPPGRSKNIADILPEGWVEPTDAEILANLLLEKPHLKTVTPDELKKHIRKEKNKISAAMSRVRLQNETRDLEGQIRKLEEEHSALSEWLSTGSGAVGQKATDVGPGGELPGEPRVAKNTLIRHFSL